MVSIPTPDPHQIIAQTQSDKSSTSRGRLKIFLGYAAGVGKTYAMLEAAHQRRKEGVDVVIGYVETHARTETDARLVDLEIIPRKSIDYHNHSLLEMDVDIVLSRHPVMVSSQSCLISCFFSLRYHDIFCVHFFRASPIRQLLHKKIHGSAPLR